MLCWIRLNFLALIACRGGGTGRRAGFKIRFWQQSASSILALGTKYKCSTYLILLISLSF